MARTLRTVTGTISRVNERGLILQEQAGVWVNISQYANPRPNIPPVGSEVALEVDTAGFVHEIRLVEAPSAPVPPATASTPPERSGATESGASGFSVARATLWVQCLQAAAMHGAGRGEYTDSAVVELADVWFRRACAVGQKKA